jgi:oligosaccharide repeat unit polymerase
VPNIQEINFLTFFAILTLTLTANYFLFRRLMFNWLDPIWFFLIINTALTLTLVIYNRFIDNDYETIFYVILCQLFFIISARSTKWVVTLNLRPFNSPDGYKEVIDSRSAIRLLNISTFILSIVLFYYYFLTFPPPNLSNDPELARVLARHQGGGSVYRLSSVIIYLSLTLWFYIRLKQIKIGWVSNSLGIMLPILLLLLVGAKASLVSVYSSFFFVSYYVSVERGQNFNISAKYILTVALCVFIFSFFILLRRSSELAAGTSLMNLAGLQLLERIIFSGIGAFHYFSTNIPDLNQLNIFDYIYQYLVIPILAPFRLVSYEPTIGSILAISITGDDTYGPNPSMYVEGKIYFGWVAGILYCGVLGAIFSVFRYYPLRFNRLPSYVRVILFSFGSSIISTMTYDMILFIGEVVNLFFILLPILLGVMLHNELISSHRNPQNKRS